MQIFNQSERLKVMCPQYNTDHHICIRVLTQKNVTPQVLFITSKMMCPAWLDLSLEYLQQLGAVRFSH